MAITISIVRLGGHRARKPVASIKLEDWALDGVRTLDDVVLAVKRHGKTGTRKKGETKGQFLKRLIVGEKPTKKENPK